MAVRSARQREENNIITPLKEYMIGTPPKAFFNSEAPWGFRPREVRRLGRDVGAAARTPASVDFEGWATPTAHCLEGHGNENCPSTSGESGGTPRVEWAFGPVDQRIALTQFCERPHAPRLRVHES